MNRLALIAIASLAMTTNAQTLPTYLDDSQDIEARVQDALSRMTTAEKATLCRAQAKFSSAGVPRLGIPELWWSDGPHGVRAEVNWNDWGYAGWNNDSVTAFPALTCLAATWNPQLAADYGKAIGQEAVYRHKNVMLGPGVNIYRTPLNGRNFEYMGEDPLLAGTMCVPYIQEVQKNGVAVSLKHYALNNQERWRGHIDVYLSDRALHEIYLPAFKMGVTQGGAWTVMGSYNKVRGEHGCNNNLLLRQILKGDWKFDGVVVTDWGGCHDTYLSAVNGLDVEMGSYTNGLTSESDFTWSDYYFGDRYIEMLEEGKIAQEIVDEQASRILRLIFRTAMNRQKPFGAIGTQEHFDVARRVATEGITLLKNNEIAKGEKLLPIDATKYKKILVVGENATRQLTKGGGSSELKALKEINPLQSLTDRYADKVVYAQGYASGKPMYGHVEEIPAETVKRLRDEAVRMAKDADLVIFIGGLNKNHLQDCEDGDRESYALPFGQNELIEELLKVNKRMIMVVVSGNAVEMPWAKSVPAIVQSWYLGSMAGPALTDILSGDVTPSGKLPFSYPVKLTDCGAHAFDTMSDPGDSITQEYKEDILVGYRWHDTKKIAPLFPFGHGLSYTTFDYSKATASAKSVTDSESLTVSVTIRNTGAVSAKETVQLYVGQVKASVLRPVKELKHFQKVSLAPGESQTVSFTISVDDLKYYDDKSAAWTAEHGKFKAYVAASAGDVKSTVDFSY